MSEEKYTVGSRWKNKWGDYREVVATHRHEKDRDDDLIVYRTGGGGGGLSSINRRGADRYWTEAPPPKWEAGKVYTSPGLRWPLHVVEVDSDGEAHGYWIERFNKPRYHGFRQSPDSRQRYTEVDGD